MHPDKVNSSDPVQDKDHRRNVPARPRRILGIANMASTKVCLPVMLLSLSLSGAHIEAEFVVDIEIVIEVETANMPEHECEIACRREEC